jgi:hypothetical protein
MPGLMLALTFGLAEGPAWAQARPPGPDLGMTLFLQNQARLQAVAYSEVRAAVEDGRRPTGDLKAARRSLKAAQEALYDQVEATQRIAVAFYAGLRKQNARRLKEALIEARADEADLRLADEAERPNAEARLSLDRQVVDGYQQNARRLSSLPAPMPRPRLPILPPRS